MPKNACDVAGVAFTGNADHPIANVNVGVTDGLAETGLVTNSRVEGATSVAFEGAPAVSRVVIADGVEEERDRTTGRMFPLRCSPLDSFRLVVDRLRAALAKIPSTREYTRKESVKSLFS